jgi:glycerol uptake facilitator-like aquaporin
MLGIYVAGDSGAYLNPAITFCNCLFRQLPWRRFPVYLVAQLLGGFVGSGIVYANYVSAIDYFEGGLRTVPPSKKATAAIFCTYPQPFLGKTNQFFSEFIASALLMFVIFALKDPSNNGVPKVCVSFAEVWTILIANRATNGSRCVSSFSSSASARALVGKPATRSTLLVILAPG